MNRHPKHPSAARLPIFAEQADPAVFSPHFWTLLVRFRPLFLLGGLWLVIICVASVAYNRLMFTGVPPQTMAEPSVREMPVARPRAATAPAPVPALTPDQAFDSQPASAPVQSDGNGHALTGWVLGSLVGLCILGSMAISRRARTPLRGNKRRSAKAKVSRPAARRPSSRPGNPLASQSAAPKRISPFSPQQDGLLVQGQKQPVPAAGAGDGLAAEQVGFSPPGQASAFSDAAQTAAPAADVSVVPEYESHPLDWSEDSVAHALDLRQRRSLSSFM